MKAIITKIQRYKSTQPDRGDFYYVFFKLDDGHGAKCCVYEKFGNYNRWRNIINASNIIGTTIDNLIMKGRGLVDADSFPKIIIEQIQEKGLADEKV